MTIFTGKSTNANVSLTVNLKESLFVDDLDRKFFVKRLSKVIEESNCLCLAATPLQKAFLLCERLRKAIEKNPMDTRKITVSIGIAATAENGPLHTPQSLVKDADDVLYEAKANGKNCVFIKEERK